MVFVNENQRTYISTLYYFGAGYCLLPLGMILLNHMTGSEFILDARFALALIFATVGVLLLVVVYNKIKEN